MTVLIITIVIFLMLLSTVVCVAACMLSSRISREQREWPNAPPPKHDFDSADLDSPQG